jgi:hypothetical protein
MLLLLSGLQTNEMGVGPPRLGSCAVCNKQVFVEDDFNKIGGPIPKLADWAVRSHLTLSMYLSRSRDLLPNSHVLSVLTHTSLFTATHFIYWHRGTTQADTRKPWTRRRPTS